MSDQTVHSCIFFLEAHARAAHSSYDALFTRSLIFIVLTIDIVLLCGDGEAKNGYPGSPESAHRGVLVFYIFGERLGNEI